MGLYASFTPEDLGFELTLSQDFLGEVLEVEVDYEPACDAFCEEFLSVSTDLVPVDTGYLQSTLDAYHDGTMCEAITECEYAQYVEYGTWKMGAQPYFTPALEAGVSAFIEEANNCMDEARQLLEEMGQEVMAEMMETLGGGEEGSLMGDVEGMLGSVLLGLVLFPILVYAYGIMRTFSDAFSLGDRNKNSPGGIVGGGVEVEII